MMNVTSFNKLCHGHFPAILKNFHRSYLLMNTCQVRQHRLVKTSSVQYLKSRLALSQFN